MPTSSVPPAARGPESDLPTVQEKMSRPSGSIPAMPGSAIDPIRELLERNNKLTQAVFDQNKKILRHFFWGSVFTWAKVLFTVAIIALAVFYASTLYKNLQKKYPFIFGQAQQKNTATSTSSTDELLKLLPISESQREQIKSFLK